MTDNKRLGIFNSSFFAPEGYLNATGDVATSEALLTTFQGEIDISKSLEFNAVDVGQRFILNPQKVIMCNDSKTTASGIINCTTNKINYDQGGADGASGGHIFTALNGASSAITTCNMAVDNTTFTNANSFNINASTIGTDKTTLTLFNTTPTTINFGGNATTNMKNLSVLTLNGLTTTNLSSLDTSGSLTTQLASKAPINDATMTGTTATTTLTCSTLNGRTSSNIASLDTTTSLTTQLASKANLTTTPQLNTSNAFVGTTNTFTGNMELNTTGVDRFLRIFDSGYTGKQAGVKLAVCNGEVQDTDAGGTVGGEAVYNQIQLGSRQFCFAQGVTNIDNFYLGGYGAGAPDPDFIMTFKKTVGVKIDGSGANTDNFTDDLHVVGTAKITDTLNCGGLTCTSFTNGTITNTKLNYLTDVTSNIGASIAGNCSKTASNTITGANTFQTGIFRMIAPNNASTSQFYGVNCGQNSTGANNNGFGNGCLQNLTTGTENNCFGKNAGQNITTGIHNTLMGCNSALGITTGEQNVALGCGTLGISNSSYNTAIGFNSLRNTSGNLNTACGITAGFDNTTGQNNCFLGYSAGQNNSALNVTTQSNKTVFCNNDTDAYHFSGASTSAINSNSTTLNLFTTPTNLNLGSSTATHIINNSRLMIRRKLAGVYMVLSGGAMFPIHFSLVDFNNMTGQDYILGETTGMVSADGGAVVGTQNGLNLSSLNQSFIVYPGWGIVVYDNTLHGTTILLNYKNTTQISQNVKATSQNSAKSIKVYFNDVIQWNTTN